MNDDVRTDADAPVDGAIDAILFDVGGTLVEAAPPGTPVPDLEVSLLPGVARTLDALARHFRLAAVTDTAVMREDEVRSLLDRGGIDRFLEVVVTSSDVGAAKPDPTSLRVALDRLAVSPARALYVGDRDIDATAAAAAGTRFAEAEASRPLHRVVLDALTDWLGPFEAARVLVAPVDDEAAAAADDHQGRLTKPRGSLGRVEALGRQLCAIAGTCPPPLPSPAAVAVFAGDHGVLVQGVSPWPREVTAQMVANFAAGGAAINVLARRAGASVTVVDVGVATAVPGDLPADRFRDRRIRAGTADLSVGPAMSLDETRAALDVGAGVALELVDGGAGALVTGDMGIGNTTPAAALIAALVGVPGDEVTGRGTGIDDATWERKAAIVRAAAQRATALAPLERLAEIGGLEHAALAGFIVGGAAAKVPVVVDGVNAVAALLVAESLAPGTMDYAIAGHRSVEPGAAIALRHLGLEPVLDLGLRLGEGTGAVLALPTVEAAAAILSEMATFDAAGVTEK